MTFINVKEIKFVNWNANGIKSKKSSLIEFLFRHNIDTELQKLTSKTQKYSRSTAIIYTERIETPFIHLEE